MPWQAAAGPVMITAGSPLTVNCWLACGDAQPLLSFTLTLKGEEPGVVVAGETDAMVAPVLQENEYPPDPAEGFAVRLTVAPWHAAAGPVMVTAGSPLTVNVWLASGDTHWLLSFTLTLKDDEPGVVVAGEIDAVVSFVLQENW